MILESHCFSPTYGHASGIFSFVLALFHINSFRIIWMLGYPLFQVGIVLPDSAKEALTRHFREITA
jgi:hypothetical protein